MPRLLRAILACLVAQCAASRLPPRLGVLRAGRSESAAEPELNEALYSRQLYVLGHAAQQSLAKSSVLVLGLSGLGAELAKNLALAGVKELHLHDDAPATMHDLATSFLLTEADVGAPRAARAVEQLAPLNPHVEVRHLEGPVDATALEAHGYTCVVAVDQTLETQLALNEAARAAGARFVSCSSRGVFGSLFADLGDAFTATDADGEPVREALLQAGAEELNPHPLSHLRPRPHPLPRPRYTSRPRPRLHPLLTITPTPTPTLAPPHQRPGCGRGGGGARRREHGGRATARSALPHYRTTAPLHCRTAAPLHCRSSAPLQG